MDSARLRSSDQRDDHVLRDINNLSCSQEFNALNFERIFIVRHSAELLTRTGLANGLPFGSLPNPFI